MQNQPKVTTGLRESIRALLIKAGFPNRMLDICTSQVLFEMGGGISRVAYVNNNYSGIRYTGKTFQRNAVKGTPFPKSEGVFYYAHFTSLNDWALDFKRVLSAGSRPALNASDLRDYVDRLAHASYFTIPASRYFEGCLHYYVSTPTPIKT